MRFWIGWYGGADGDCRPIKEDDNLPAWAVSGERFGEPEFSLVACLDAENEDGAWKVISEYWPEAEKRFCEEKDDDYMPRDDDNGRFKAIADKMKAKTNA